MTDDRPRRRLALSIRGLLVAVTACALGLGWWVNGARQQEEALAAIRAYDAHANFWYDDQFADDPGAGTTTDGVTIDLRRKSWEPSFLVSHLGKDYFHDVTSLAFGQGATPAARACDKNELFRQLGRLRGLQQLGLYVEAGDDDVTRISDLRRLKRLDLWEPSPRLTDAAFRTIGRMRSVEALTIADAPLSDAGLAHLGMMTGLKSLALGKVSSAPRQQKAAGITDAGLARLAGLRNLVELELNAPAVTGEGLKHLAAMKGLKRLRLDCPRLTDADLRHLAPLTALESIDLVGTNVSGAGFDRLGHLSSLQYLCLEGPNVSDAAIPPLARLPGLESLMIYGSKVTAAGLEGLGAAPRLRGLGLVPAVTGDTKRLKAALPNCGVLNGGNSL